MRERISISAHRRNEVSLISRVIVGLAFLAVLSATSAQAAPHDFVVYAPGMGGTAEQAKPFLERFFRYVEKPMGWTSGGAQGEYFDQPADAEKYIREKQPGFGLVSPGLFVQLSCGKDAPEPLVATVGIGGLPNPHRFHVIVKKGSAAKKLADLKGKKLSSNHLHDLKFVSRVILGGDVDAEKFFQLVPTNSPIKPFKAVDRGEADAALVDEAQLANIKKTAIGDSFEVVYTSQPLPTFPVVAFKQVLPAEREKMKKTLLGMCLAPPGSEVCKALGFERFEPIDAGGFKPAVQ